MALLTSPAPPEADAAPRREIVPAAARPWLVAAVLVALAGVVLADLATGAISGLMSLWLVHGVAIPVALLGLRPRLGRVALGLALAVAIALPGIRTAATVLAEPTGQLSHHDGGVVVTQAAAEDVVAGRNPYAADFSGALPAYWESISVDGSEAFDNPIRTTYPYLPGAFLAVAPLAAVGDGDLADPRWVMLATFVVAAVAIARRPEPVWARVAALSAFSGPIVAVHLAYGTNDTWAASLLVLAVLAVERRPRLAGVLAALAISVKFLVLPPVLLWVAWRWRREGWTALRRVWTLPATLAATCAPFLLWGPADMLDDTVLFWLGRGDHPFPVSGFGLAARHPDLVQGPVLAVATVASAALGVALAAALVRRVRHRLALAPAAALVVLGLLVPARTFQGNYLVMVVGLAATIWLALGATGGEDPAIR